MKFRAAWLTLPARVIFSSDGANAQLSQRQRQAVVLEANASLVGAIPFGWLFVTVLKKTDLREVGSKNIGATNASRVLGGAWSKHVAPPLELRAATGSL